MSTIEIAKVFTKPTSEMASKERPLGIIDAHSHLEAKQKLALFLCSKATVDIEVQIGDMIDVHYCTSMNKRGVWSTPKNVLEPDLEAHSITSLGKIRTTGNSSSENHLASTST